MTLAHNLRLACTFAWPVAVCTIAGLPVHTAMTHGLDPATWPSGAMQPATWWWRIRTGNVPEIVAPYLAMLEGTSSAFVGGGRTEFWGLFATCAIAPLLHILTTKTAPQEIRDASGQLGNARWSNKKEKAAMHHGLEVGIDPETGNPIRLAIESNVFSVAPPRTGKTSSLIIPNALAAGVGAWNGPIVLIDPKGEVFDVAARRRAQLGRNVVRFDLRRGARNSHRWNPLHGIAPDDTERLLAMAKVGVVEGGTENAYFSNRAVDVLAGAMSAELLDAARSRRVATLARVAHLLSDPNALLEIARTGETQILRSLTGDLQLDERSRDQLLSTAKTAVSWLQEERFAKLTARSTFSMTDVVRGHVDLFIIMSPGSMELLAPLLRMLLADIMWRALTDRQPDDDRLVILADEAAQLGKFSEMKKSVGLLPGLGISFWTFWQSIGQVQEIYGAAGSKIFIDTAEVITISDLALLGDDADDVSRALGKYTAFVEATSEQTTRGGQSTGTSKVKQAMPLMKPEELREMKPHELIVLLNSKRYGKHPLRLHKSKYYEDPRFYGLYRDVKPTGAL